MANETAEDYYEVLQISPKAEPETINRVFRILAQRYHPDNKETGNEIRFRVIHQAYQVLSDPVRRAQYDVTHRQQRDDRWRLDSADTEVENDFELEQLVRLTLLEVLYTRRRRIPNNPGLFVLDFEELLGRPREHLEFTVWYLIQKGLLKRTDDSKFAITADGVEFLEKNHQGRLHKRLSPKPPA
jgi:curved DNA-binding protein CbpA